MRLPDIGELNRRVRLISVTHDPTGDAKLVENRQILMETWAKCEIIGGSAYWDSVNVDEARTHRFYVRYVKGRTAPIDLRRLTQLECEGAVYAVRRVTDVNGAHRFTMLECEELTNG